MNGMHTIASATMQGYVIALRLMSVGEASTLRPYYIASIDGLRLIDLEFVVCVGDTDVVPTVMINRKSMNENIQT